MVDYRRLWACPWTISPCQNLGSRLPSPALSCLFAIHSTLAPSVPCGMSGMLKITLHDSAREFRFHLEGRLTGPWVDELRQCWQTAISTTEGRTIVLDLHEVDFIDPAGGKLLS